MSTAPSTRHRPSPNRAAAGRRALSRDELYRAVVAERFGVRPQPAVRHPGPGPSRQYGIPGAEQTAAYVRRLASYRWTAGQISAVTGLTVQQVRRMLPRASTPTTLEGEAP